MKVKISGFEGGKETTQSERKKTGKKTEQSISALKEI